MRFSGVIIAMLLFPVAVFPPPLLASTRHDAARQGNLQEIVCFITEGVGAKDWHGTAKPLLGIAEKGHFSAVALLIR